MLLHLRRSCGAPRVDAPWLPPSRCRLPRLVHVPHFLSVSHYSTATTALLPCLLPYIFARSRLQTLGQRSTLSRPGGDHLGRGAAFAWRAFATPLGFCSCPVPPFCEACSNPICKWWLRTPTRSGRPSAPARRLCGHAAACGASGPPHQPAQVRAGLSAAGRARDTACCTGQTIGAIVRTGLATGALGPPGHRRRSAAAARVTAAPETCLPCLSDHPASTPCSRPPSLLQHLAGRPAALCAWRPPPRRRPTWRRSKCSPPRALMMPGSRCTW